MILEALKKPPSKIVHKEVARFMTNDKKMSSFVQDFTQHVVPNMTDMIKSGAPPGANLSGLSKLGAALTGMSDPLVKKKKKKKKKKRRRTSKKKSRSKK